MSVNRGLTGRERILVIIGATGLVAVLALTGLLVYALTRASIVALRWWAGLTTAALPPAGLIAFYLGRVEARGRVAGLTQGIEAVSQAAQKTADIRVTTLQRTRQRLRQQTPAIQQVFLPGSPGFAGGQGGGVIAPPRLDAGEEEVVL